MDSVGAFSTPPCAKRPRPRNSPSPDCKDAPGSFNWVAGAVRTLTDRVNRLEQTASTPKPPEASPLDYPSLFERLKTELYDTLLVNLNQDFLVYVNTDLFQRLAGNLQGEAEQRVTSVTEDMAAELTTRVQTMEILLEPRSTECDKDFEPAGRYVDDRLGWLAKVGQGSVALGLSTQIDKLYDKTRDLSGRQDELDEIHPENIMQGFVSHDELNDALLKVVGASQANLAQSLTQNLSDGMAKIIEHIASSLAYNQGSTRTQRRVKFEGD